MSRRLIQILVILFCHCSAFAQNTESDLVNKYITESDSLENTGDFKNAILLRKKALNLLQVQSPSDYKVLVETHLKLGRSYRRWGKYLDSFQYQQKAINLAEKHLSQDHKTLAESYNGLGGYYYGKQKFRLALEQFEMALSIALESNLKSTGNYFNNVGISYQALGDPTQAMETYIKALKYNQLTFGFNHKNTADNYDNIGTLYYNLNEFEKSLAYLDTAELILNNLKL